MPPWFKIASLRSALSLGRHRVEAASDAITMVDRLRGGRDVPRSPDISTSRPADPARNPGKGRARS